MNDFKTTIIVPCIKNNDLLLKCIDKCFKLKNNIEVFVVTEDDQIPDLPYKDVKFFNFGKIYMSKKRNMAAKLSHAKYLAFIDSDAYPDLNWIDGAVAELTKDPTIGMVGGPELSTEGETLWELCVGMASRSFLITGSHSFRKQISPRRFYTEMSACNIIIEREMYLRVNGMNEDLYIAEDHDFGKRILQTGMKILFSPDVIVHHKNRSFFPFLVQRYARGMLTATFIKRFIEDLAKTKNVSKKLKAMRLFRWEFLMPPSFIVFICSFFLVFFSNIWTILYFSIMAFYSFVLFIESCRYAEKLRHIPIVFITLMAGTLISGVAGLLSLLNFDLDIKKFYRNENDSAVKKSPSVA